MEREPVDDPGIPHAAAGSGNGEHATSQEMLPSMSSPLSAHDAQQPSTSRAVNSNIQQRLPGVLNSEQIEIVQKWEAAKYKHQRLWQKFEPFHLQLLQLENKYFTALETVERILGDLYCLLGWLNYCRESHTCKFGV